MKSGIYKITNSITNKIYIGSAINCNDRWSKHKSALNKNKHGNRYLQNAWNKYWQCMFIFEVIQYVEKDKLLETEQQWLDKTKCYERNIGYNLYKVVGSPIGTIHSDEIRKRMSLAHIGTKQSEETKKKRSVSLKGRILTQKAKDNLRFYQEFSRDMNRNEEKWPCHMGIRCTCDSCMSKKREYKKLWARRKALKPVVRTLG